MTTLTVKDGNGALQNFDVTVDGSGNYVSRHVICDGTAAATFAAVVGTALKVDNSAVTQPVSIATMPSTPVTGAFWQATQPVSGTFWQVTQPVSIATSPVLVAGSALIGKVGIDQTTPGTTNAVQANAGTNLNTSALATSTNVAAVVTALGTPAQNGTGYAASGLSAVTGTFTGTGQSASFTPLAGRGFNISTRGTFAASYQLERSFDSGSNWHPFTASGTQLYVWTTPASETGQEDQVGVLYRLNCTSYTSGTVNYRLSQ